MKKLFLAIILSCFLVANARALSPTFLQLVAGSDTAACDDCSGSLKFAWHMEDNDSTPDVTLGSPCGCSDGDTIGVENGSPVFSSAQKSDGTYSLHINALNERYVFTATEYDVIDLRDLKLTFDIYIVSYPSGGTYTEFFTSTEGDANNFLVLRIAGTGTIINVSTRSGGTQEYLSTPAISTGSWISCEYQAKHNVSGVDHYMNCTGVAAVEEDDDFVNYTGDGSGDLIVGDNTGDEAGEYYLDNVKIDTSDRY